MLIEALVPILRVISSMSMSIAELAGFLNTELSALVILIVIVIGCNSTVSLNNIRKFEKLQTVKNLHKKEDNACTLLFK